MAARGQGFIFPMYLCRKFLKSSCPKPLDLFQYNLAEMFLSSSTKIVQAIIICWKIWPLGGRDVFSLYICIENFKNLLLRNH